MKNKSSISAFIPVMFAFFCCGFVDLVGSASNYIKYDFQLSDTAASLLSSMVFFWFLIVSVPTGILMNKIGRKKTVLISLIITIIGLLIPSLYYTFGSMLLSFSFIGIGNTLMQVALNPLLSGIVSKQKLASSLTFGQFIKAIASFIAPIIAGQAAVYFGNWRLLFPVFMVIAIISVLYLGGTPIHEEKEEKEEKQNHSSFSDCFALLKNGLILILFLGIVCHVGIDVGINMIAPKILMERFNLNLDKAVYATSIYFIFRTFGCLIGSLTLSRFSPSKFFVISVLSMLVATLGLFIFHNLIFIYACIGLMGLGNSNIFPIIISKALLYMPDKKNEISGLMIMGIVGGAILPLFMGFLADIIGSQVGALIVILLSIIYLIFVSKKLNKIK